MSNIAGALGLETELIRDWGYRILQIGLIPGQGNILLVPAAADGSFIYLLPQDLAGPIRDQYLGLMT